jgi:uncharacterized repeat protein (TIGR01451 family)
VRIEADFPATLSGVSWSCSAQVGSTCQDLNGSGDIDTRLNLGVSGQATLMVNATISPEASGLLVSSVRVSPPAGVSDPNTLNNLAYDSDTLTPQVSYDFTKTDQRTSIAPGEAISYTITLLNDGPSAVSGVTILDEFPAIIEEVSWNCVSSSGASCGTRGPVSGNINLRVDLAPGSSVIVLAGGRLSTSATGVITNTSRLASPVVPLNDVLEATDTTVIVPHSDLALSVAAPAQVNLGEQVVYTIQVKNQGPSSADQVMLVSQIPSEANFLSASPGSPTCTLSENTLTCNLGDLAAGDNAQAQFVLAPELRGILVVHTNASTGETDPDLHNNAVTTEVRVD